MTYVWCVADECERSLKFIEEQGGRRSSMSPPPAIDDADLIVRLWSGANVEVHRRRRSSSISADAGQIGRAHV